MPKSLWKLPDAIAIAARLTGLLPDRPARGVDRITRRWPIATIAVVLAGCALAIAYAVSMLMQ